MKKKLILLTFIYSLLISLSAYEIVIDKTPPSQNIENKIIKQYADKTYLTDKDGNQYGIIISPYTSKKWLDRNLGASRVCQSYNDSSCYGDYFQWGASQKGWKKNYSSNNNLWQGKNAKNNPCPKGFRVPTIDELLAETIIQGVENSSDAYNNFLKLTTAGDRDGDGSKYDRGSWSFLWSSSVDGKNSLMVGFGSGATYEYGNDRAYAFSVRCIKN